MMFLEKGKCEPDFLVAVRSDYVKRRGGFLEWRSLGPNGMYYMPTARIWAWYIYQWFTTEDIYGATWSFYHHINIIFVISPYFHYFLSNLFIDSVRVRLSSNIEDILCSAHGQTPSKLGIIGPYLDIASPDIKFCATSA